MGRERPAGARVGSRLFRDLGGRRHRPAAVGAGDGGARVEIRGASSLGSVEAGERPPTWNACRKSPKACGRRDRCVGIAPMPQHGQATTGGLEHAAPLERDRGTVRSAEPALGAAIGRLSLAAAAAAQEQASGGLGWLGSADRDLRDGLSRRHSRPRDPPLGVRVRRAPARRSGGVRVGRLTDEPPAPHDPRNGNRPRYHALQSTSAEPGRATPTRRAGCFWSALRSRRCASGWSVPTSRRADPPGDRPTGLRGGEGAHTAVDQSDRQAALRHGGVGAGGVFRRTDVAPKI
jgi:hypothetical protein